MAMPLNEGDSATMPVDEEPAPATQAMVQIFESLFKSGMNLSARSV